MSKIPACFVCTSTPAELALFGRPYCETCAIKLVSTYAARNRSQLAERNAARRSQLSVVQRDGVSYVVVGDKLYPAIDAPDDAPVLEL